MQQRSNSTVKVTPEMNGSGDEKLRHTCKLRYDKPLCQKVFFFSLVLRSSLLVDLYCILQDGLFIFPIPGIKIL